METLPRSLPLRSSCENKGVTTLPKSLKYAHVERERRYLSKGMTPGLRPTRVLRIQDRYISDSSFRLRRIDEEGNSPVFKLGQKKRIEGDSPLRIAHTTMYISEDEFNLLAVLPANTLEKQRLIFPLGDSHFAVDVFEGKLEGLLLAEVDLGSEGATHPALPLEEFVEVTLDERFTGGKLAGTSSTDLQSTLTEYGVN